MAEIYLGVPFISTARRKCKHPLASVTGVVIGEFLASLVSVDRYGPEMRSSPEVVRPLATAGEAEGS